MVTSGAAVVNGRGARRARRGHPWIYRDDVLEVDGQPGAVVRVVERAGGFCCWAALSLASPITLRRVSTAQPPPDDDFWRRRLAQAISLRRERALAGPGCARLLHADGEGFPGLTVDRYGEHLVVQATTPWAERNAPELVAQLAQEIGATTALARNDAAQREQEGLAREITPLIGHTPDELEVEEGGVRRIVDPWRGHKTGLYLDQQTNHRRAPGWLTGRVLDLFAAEGGFALPLAAAGAEVVAVEQSAALVERGRRSAARAGLAERVTFIGGNVFELCEGPAALGAPFDAVILDPPPFARRRAAAPGALRGHRELHRRALDCLRPNGRLLTFSCSFAIDDAAFESVVRMSAEDAYSPLRVLARPGAAEDHPEWLCLPESRYLRGLLLQRAGA